MLIDHVTWDCSFGNESPAPSPLPLLGPHSWPWLWDCRNDKMPRGSILGCKRLSVILVSSRYHAQRGPGGWSMQLSHSHAEMLWHRWTVLAVWRSELRGATVRMPGGNLLNKVTRERNYTFTPVTRDSSCLYSVEAPLPARCDQRHLFLSRCKRTLDFRDLRLGQHGSGWLLWLGSPGNHLWWVSSLPLAKKHVSQWVSFFCYDTIYWTTKDAQKPRPAPAVETPHRTQTLHLDRALWWVSVGIFSMFCICFSSSLTLWTVK